PLHHQATNDAVNFLGRYRRSLIKPPGEHRHEGPRQELHRKPPLLGRSLEAEGLDIQLREVCDRSMDPLYNEGAALATHDRAIQCQMAARVLEHRETEPERPRSLPPPFR